MSQRSLSDTVRSVCLHCSYTCLLVLQFVSFCFRLISMLLVAPFVFLSCRWFDSDSEIDPVFASMYDSFPFCSPPLKPFPFMYPPSLTEVCLHTSPFDSPVLPIKPVVSGSINLSQNLDFNSCSLHSLLLKLPNHLYSSSIYNRLCIHHQYLHKTIQPRSSLTLLTLRSIPGHNRQESVWCFASETVMFMFGWLLCSMSNVHVYSIILI